MSFRPAVCSCLPGGSLKERNFSKLQCKYTCRLINLQLLQSGNNRNSFLYECCSLELVTNLGLW